MPEKADENKEHDGDSQRCHGGAKGLAAAREGFLREQSFRAKPFRDDALADMVAAAELDGDVVLSAHAGDGALLRSLARWQPGADEHGDER